MKCLCSNTKVIYTHDKHSMISVEKGPYQTQGKAGQDHNLSLFRLMSSTLNKCYFKTHNVMCNMYTLIFKAHKVILYPFVVNFRFEDLW